MSDYRDPNDPMYGNPGYASRFHSTRRAYRRFQRAVFLVIVLALAFGVGHEPSRVASNDTTQSAATRMAPPAGTMSPAPSAVPGLAPPPAATPAPNKP